jgi:hypothetical protein
MSSAATCPEMDACGRRARASSPAIVGETGEGVIVRANSTAT